MRLKLFGLCLALLAWATHGNARAAADAAQDREAEMFGTPAKPVASAVASPGTEADREAEMFGNPTPKAGQAPGSETDREVDMFGKPTAAPQSPQDEAQIPNDAAAGSPAGLEERLGAGVERGNNFLDVGGFLFLLSEWDILGGNSTIQTWPLTSPNLMDLYFDARPSDRVRGYFRGRATYNPTVVPGTFNPFTLSTLQQTALLLDQFWIKFDVARTVFVTVGRQPIRWGAGRFWNPTDFLNRQRRDPLAIFDQRVGVTLLKLNVPLEQRGWNFYGLVDISNVSTADYLGGALRAEILIDQAEISLTVAKKKDGPLQLGIDTSVGVGLFDLKLEIAASHGVQQRFYGGSVTRLIPQYIYYYPDKWFVQVVGGGEISIRYSDEDTIALGAEYFYNQLGYDNPDYYLPAFLDFASRGLAPPILYLGQHYMAAYALLAKPGSWNNTTFTGSVIANLSDKSVLARLDYQVRLLTYLDLNLYGVYHFGQQGELRLGFNLPGGTVPGLSAGMVREPPRFDVGGGLRLYF